MNTKEAKVESPFQLIRTFVSSLSIQNTCLETSLNTNGERKIDVSYEILHKSITDDNNHLALLAMTIKIETKTDDGLFDLDMTIQGVFTASAKDTPEKVFIKMLRVNGCSALYSVARGVICSISSQLFTGGNVIIPLVNFVRFREIESKE